MKEWKKPRTCGECAEFRDGACMQSFEEAWEGDPACPLFEPSTSGNAVRPSEGTSEGA